MGDPYPESESRPFPGWGDPGTLDANFYSRHVDGIEEDQRDDAVRRRVGMTRVDHIER